MLLLIATIPLLAESLPDSAELVAAPLFVLMCSCTVILVPSVSVLQTLGACFGAIIVTLFSVHQTSPSGLSIVALIPLATLILDLRAIYVVTISWLSLVIMFMAVPESFQSVYAIGGTTPTDIAGYFCLAGWGAWIGSMALRIHVAKTQSVLAFEAVSALRQGLERDRAELVSIAQYLADPRLVPRMMGQGLAPDRLNMATWIEKEKRILFASFRGNPMATISVGWALRAAANTGMLDPKNLHEYARSSLDEMVSPDCIDFIGVVDPATDHCNVSPHDALDEFSKPFTSFDPAIGPHQNAPSIDAFFDLPPVATKPQDKTWHIVMDIVTVALFPLSMMVTVRQPAIFCGLWVALGLAVHHVIESRFHRTRRHAAQLDKACESYVECRDDVHNTIARVHGSMLPYEIRTEHFQATAHRLRGDVLDGTFADMLVDRYGRIRISTGQIAGEGVAARFLGLSAQASTHAVAKRGIAWKELRSTIKPVIRSAAIELNYPLRFELGMVNIGPEGTVEGLGCLARMVTTSDNPDNAPICATAYLQEGRSVFLTPVTSRPGPDEDVPAISSDLASSRVSQVITEGKWKPYEDALPSLFSLVFNGTDAPSHGTLIRLTRMTEEQSEEYKSQNAHQAPLSIAIAAI